LKATTPSKLADQKRYTLCQMKKWRATVSPTVLPPLNCPLRGQFGGLQSFMRTLKYSKKDLVGQKCHPLANRSPDSVTNEIAFQMIRSPTESSSSILQLLEVNAPVVERTPQRVLLGRQFSQINTIIARTNGEEGSVRRTRSVSKLLSTQSVSTLSIDDPEVRKGMVKSTSQTVFVENTGTTGSTTRTNSVNSLTNLLSTPSESVPTIFDYDDDDEGLSRASQVKRIDLYDLKIVYCYTYEEALDRRRVDTNSGSCSFCHVCHIAFEIKVLLYHHCERQHGELFRIPFAVIGVV
jgi:hypothetical protein